MFGHSSRNSTFVRATAVAFALSALLSSTAWAGHFGGGGFRPVTKAMTFAQPIGAKKKIEHDKAGANLSPGVANVPPHIKQLPQPRLRWGNGCEACPPGGFHQGMTPLRLKKAGELPAAKAMTIMEPMAAKKKIELDKKGVQQLSGVASAQQVNAGNSRNPIPDPVWPLYPRGPKGPLRSTTPGPNAS